MKLLRMGAALALTLWVPSVLCAQSLDNQGTDFLMTFLPNYLGADAVELHLTGATATEVTVEYPVIVPTFTETVMVQPGTVTIVSLPLEAAEGWTPGVVQDQAVRAYADEEFVCYMINRVQYSSDAAVALPIDTLNTDYFLTTYTALNSAEFAIVAPYDYTRVNIVPKSTLVGGFGARTPFTIVLQAGQTFFGSAQGNGADLTGSIISANRPIGVTNGNQCTLIPKSAYACDHVFQVAHPLQTWGTQLLAADLPNRPGGSIYRVIASQNNTEIFTNGVSRGVLNRGASLEIGPLSGNIEFYAEKPIFVTQFMTGQTSPGATLGDPAMGSLVPTEQYLSEYTFSTVGGEQFVQNYLTIIAEDADVDTILLDGVPIGGGNFSLVAASGFSVAVVPLSDGTHTTSSTGIHGITVEGYNAYDSYIYPGGALFKFINPVGDPWDPVCQCTQEEDVMPYFACAATDNTPSEDINGNGLLDPGEDDNDNGIVDRDTGIYGIELLEDAVNLVLTLDSYLPGDKEVTYRVDLLNPAADGSGTVRVTDGVGNTCDVFVELEGNSAPFCDADEAYQQECAGDVTTIDLNGSGSTDPDPEDELTYKWSSNCPGADFDDDGSATPQLTLDSACAVDCTVYLTVTDERLVSSNCSATVSISDTTPPQLELAADNLTVECDGLGNNADLAGWRSDHGGASATDVCGDVTWSDDFAGLSDLCGATGAADVTFTAEDECNLTVDTWARFAIVDTTAPQIVTDADDLTVESDGLGNQTELDGWLANHGGAQANDTCGAVTWSNDFSGIEYGCGGTGSAIVTFTATDACGLTATTSATFSIEDATPPTIQTEAGDLTVECDGTGNLTDLNNWLNNRGGAQASDASGEVTWTDNFIELIPGCGATGAATVIFTATDACGSFTSTSATFSIVDTAAPDLSSPADDLTVECDGSGNQTELDNWLLTRGGATANDACGAVQWSNNFDGLEPGCGVTGTAAVTFTATDECEQATASPASFTIADTTPPALTCPQPITLGAGETGSNPQIQAWLASAEAHDACDPDVVIENDAPDDFAFDTSTTVTFTATDECGNENTCTSTITVRSPQIGDVTTKGSVIIYPEVEIRWREDGTLIQDTYISISNDYPGYVPVQMYFFNGDPPLDATANDRDHLGWNWVGDQFALTGNQSTYWAASSGQPVGLSPYTILDPSDDPLQQGRPANDGTTDRVLRGFVLAWAINADGFEICWNHLAGKALIIRYDQAAAWEYNAYAFVCRSVEHGMPTVDPGVIALDGSEYDFCPNLLLMDFCAVGTDLLSSETVPVSVDTDLTLFPVKLDARQETEGHVTTKAKFDIWNENEVKFSGTERCITCWDQKLLGLYDPPNHFSRWTLQTNAGRARIDGLGSTVVCGPNAVDAPMLGTAMKLLSFNDGADLDLAGTNLAGAGYEAGFILYDPLPPPPELSQPALNSALRTGSLNRPGTSASSHVE